MQLSIPTHCYHSPKKELLTKLNIAFATGDVAMLAGAFDPNIIWEMIGDRTICGVETVTKYLESIAPLKATELIIHNIITHGKSACVHGMLVFKNGTVAFADVYDFKSAGSGKIVRMTSYPISIPSGEKTQGDR